MYTAILPSLVVLHGFGGSAFFVAVFAFHSAGLPSGGRVVELVLLVAGGVGAGAGVGAAGVGAAGVLGVCCNKVKDSTHGNGSMSHGGRAGGGGGEWS